MRVESDHELAEGYLHMLDRPCDCRAVHGQVTPNPTVAGRVRPRRQGHASQWEWVDVVRTTDFRMRDYTTGKTIAVHRRFDLVTGKDFRWYSGGTAGLHGLPEADLPLYRGYEVLHTTDAASNVVLLNEGEKATNAVADLGLAAVGICIGAPKVPHLAVLQPLAAMYSLVIWPDADDKGQELADRLGRLLHSVVIPLRVLEWPDAPPKGDAADFVAQGGTRADVLALIDVAKYWSESTQVTKPEANLRRLAADAALARSRDLSAQPRPRTYDLGALPRPRTYDITPAGDQR
jgi:hypothetical protein